MKRSLSFLALLLLMSPFMHLHGQSGLRPRGDVNRDWEVSVADVNRLTDAIIARTPYHSFYTYDFDINGDKEINIADINMLIDGLLGDVLPPMPAYSGTLPVLFINTEGHHDIVSKEEYLHADWWIDAMGIEGYESFGSPEAPLGMNIKGRGNYTWNKLSKKSFGVKLDDKMPLLGLKENRHFCLMTHADDHLAKLKDEVGFELSRRIGLPYAPVQKPVEVVMNGVYIGLYFLCEKIRVEKDRVNVIEQDNYETDSSKITGGWLIEIDNTQDENTVSVLERNDGSNWSDWLMITSHSPDYLSAEQKHYIRNLISKVNTEIYRSQKVIAGWERYIDIDTLAAFYIIQEIVDNVESFSGSCYMHKQRGDDTKLLFGPVWDFGNAFNRGMGQTCHFIYEQPTRYFPHWIEEIAKFPKFQWTIRKQWRQFYPSVVNESTFDGYIDQFVENIRRASCYDDRRWGRETDLDKQKERFKSFFHLKVEWLNSQWSLEQDTHSDPKDVF